MIINLIGKSLIKIKIVTFYNNILDILLKSDIILVSILLNYIGE